MDHAHQLGYWIRFYTLDGFTSGNNQGWFQGYNFGNFPAARIRCKAAIDVGVNLIASDQYEDLAVVMQNSKR